MHVYRVSVHEIDADLLLITASNSLATNWLAPRLAAFQVAHPAIGVRIDVSAKMIDFTRETFDVGLRSGRGDWPGLKAHRLMPQEFTPLCSPEFLARAPKLTAPADLLQLPLLDWRDEWWRQWFALAGILDPKPVHRTPFEIDSQVTLARAAMAGQGVAILMPAFFLAEIAAGRLAQPFDIVAASELSYWLVYPEERQDSPKICAFREWILEEVKRDLAQAAA